MPEFNAMVNMNDLFNSMELDDRREFIKEHFNDFYNDDSDLMIADRFAEGVKPSQMTDCINEMFDGMDDRYKSEVLSHVISDSSVNIQEAFVKELSKAERKTILDDILSNCMDEDELYDTIVRLVKSFPDELKPSFVEDIK